MADDVISIELLVWQAEATLVVRPLGVTRDSVRRFELVEVLRSTIELPEIGSTIEILTGDHETRKHELAYTETPEPGMHVSLDPFQPLETVTSYDGLPDEPEEPHIVFVSRLWIRDRYWLVGAVRGARESLAKRERALRAIRSR